MSHEHEIAERLKIIRIQQLAVSQREFASRLGVSSGLIGQIETGMMPVSIKVIRALEERFNVNPEWLTDGIEPMFQVLRRSFVGRNLPVEPPDYSRPLHGDLKFGGQEYAFVRRMDISVSAGRGLVPVDDGDAETIALPTRWFIRQGIAADLSVLVSVKGDSMAPGIPDGALVLLSITDTLTMKPGIYAFNLDGQSYIKRIQPAQLGPDGRPQTLLLISDNQAYPPMAVSGPDMNAITWIGRVRAVLTTL